MIHSWLHAFSGPRLTPIAGVVCLLCKRTEVPTCVRRCVRRCRQPGHWSRDCPMVGGSGSAHSHGGGGTVRHDG